MTKDLELKLVQKYPTIFRDYRGDMRQTCMTWGFECGDGWYQLIDDLCSDLKQLKGEVVAEQVKEKYGGLRFYAYVVGVENEEEADKIFDRIDKAEDDSYHICEVCGKKGELNDDMWLQVRCKKH